MSDFEKWFKTTEAYKMLEEQNYFKMDLFFFVGARNQYRHSGVQVAYLTWQHQQAIIDSLKAQLNNMEACYIEKKKEVEELQKTNISLEAGLRKNSKNKQKLLGKNIELQKRIDDGLQVIFECRVIGADRIYTCDMAEKALRGAND